MKLSNTNQRRIIMEELKKLYTHPTAEDLYAIVKNRLPQISLATVYRNLDILSEAGEVLKLEMAGKQKRFDGNTMPHYHLRCTVCGAVEDISIPEMDDIQKQLNRISNQKISKTRIEFEGLCECCLHDDSRMSAEPLVRHDNTKNQKQMKEGGK